MKKKSHKDKTKDSLNDTSTTLFEPSFSKITFRKREHENNEKLSDVDEEQDIHHNYVDFVVDEKINELTCQTEVHKKKKKKKKKEEEKKENDNELHFVGDRPESEISGTDGEKYKPIQDLDTEFESKHQNLLPVSSKKKKKRNLSEDVLKVSPDRDQNHVGDPCEVNQLNYSDVTVPKKKRKHSSEEASCDFNLSKSDITGLNDSSLDVPKKKRKCKSKDPLSKLSEGENNIESDEGGCLLPDSTDNLKGIEDAKNSPKCKKGKSISAHHSKLITLKDSTQLVIQNSETFNTPVTKNKNKKAKKSLDESYLSTSDKNMDTNEDGIVCLNNSSVEHLPKKDKELHGNFNTEIVSMGNNNNHIAIKSTDHEFNFLKKTEHNKMVITEPSTFSLHPTSTDASLNDVLKVETNVKQKKQNLHSNYSEENDILKALDLQPKELKEISCEKKKKNKLKKGHVAGKDVSKKEVCSDVQQNLSLSTKKKKIKNSVESLRNQLLKQACATEESADSLVKSRKQNLGSNNVDDLRKCLLKNAWASKEPKSGKHISVEKQNLEIEKKNSHKKNKTSIRGIDNKSIKSRKKGVAENLDSLIEPSHTKAISTSRVPEEFSARESGEKTNAETLRKLLLTEAISELKTDKVFLPKKVKQKESKGKSIQVKNYSRELDKVKEKKSKKKNLKNKGNDIDFLTNNLISKALEKVASSSSSHSSQENINVLESKMNSSGLKNQRENKVTLKQNDAKVKSQKSRQQFKIDKMKKALLSSALENMNPGFKSQKNSKQKNHNR